MSANPFSTTHAKNAVLVAMREACLAEFFSVIRPLS